MKLRTLLLFFGLLAILLILIGAYKAVSAPLPEGFPSPTPAGKIEVKEYPAYRSGTLIYEGRLSQATGAAFEPLYRHISSNEISMTAPVEARYPSATLKAGGKDLEQGQVEVSFLYRHPDIQPRQLTPEIKLQDSAPMTVISVGVRGAYSYASYQQHLEQLSHWLAQHPDYQVAGPPRRFFYDSPFIPDPLKRSEVQIPIRVASAVRSTF